MKKAPLMKMGIRMTGLVFAIVASLGQLHAADLSVVIHTAGNQSEALAVASDSASISVLLIDPQTGQGIDLADSAAVLPTGWQLNFGPNPPVFPCSLIVTNFIDDGGGRYRIEVEPRTPCTPTGSTVQWFIGEYHYSLTVEGTDGSGNLRRGTALGVLIVHDVFVV